MARSDKEADDRTPVGQGQPTGASDPADRRGPAPWPARHGDKRAKVYIVTPGGLAEKGGMGRLMSNITGHWRDTGGGPAYRIIDPYGPANLLIMPFYLIRALGQVLRGALRGEIALLHIHMAAWGSAMRKGLFVHLGRGLGIPVILHLHAGDLAAFGAWLPGLARRALAATVRRADRIVVLGEAWRAMAIKAFDLEPATVTVLPNAVAGPVEPPRRAPGDTCRIVYLGRIETEKGIGELLRALADERLAALSWRASLVGDGAIAEYRRQAADLGLGERVVFTGWQDAAAIDAILSESDIFVLPSHFEGLSVALLEALAYGLAPVATPVGATEEVIVAGESGLLVPVGDSQGLAAALASLITDRALRAKLQAGARRRFNQNFEISGYCQRLEALYRELIEPPTAD